MNDKDYKVIALSPNEAKPYTNSYGTTYYRDVRLADSEGNEHPKPVSIGKKDAAAFKVGMELHGHILVEQSFPTDKFKSVSKQQGGFGGAGFSAPAGSQKHEYKDNSDGQRQGMCFNNAANYITASTPPERMLEADMWAKHVYNYANALYKLGDLGSSESTNPKAQTPAPTTGQSNPTRLKPGAPVWPSDVQADAEAQSLYDSIAASGGEPVPTPGGW